MNACCAEDGPGLFLVALHLLTKGTLSHPFSFSSTHSNNNRKDAKKVTKLESQIPYHAGRGNNDEVEKIKGQIEAIWQKTRDAFYAEN